MSEGRGGDGSDGDDDGDGCDRVAGQTAQFNLTTSEGMSIQGVNDSIENIPNKPQVTQPQGQEVRKQTNITCFLDR